MPCFAWFTSARLLATGHSTQPFNPLLTHPFLKHTLLAQSILTHPFIPLTDIPCNLLTHLSNPLSNPPPPLTPSTPSNPLFPTTPSNPLYPHYPFYPTPPLLPGRHPPGPRTSSALQPQRPLPPPPLLPRRLPTGALESSMHHHAAKRCDVSSTHHRHIHRYIHTHTQPYTRPHAPSYTLFYTHHSTHLPFLIAGLAPSSIPPHPLTLSPYRPLPLLAGAGSKPQASTLPPLEFIPALCTLHWTVAKLKSHFDEWFLEPLSALPNAVTLCREGRRMALRALETVARESLQGTGPRHNAMLDARCSTHPSLHYNTSSRY